MKLNQLITPKIQKKVFNIKDFSAYSDFCPNVLIGEELTSIKQKVAFLGYVPSTVKKVYFIHNKILIYTSDKYVNEYKTNKLIKLDTCPSQPVLVSIMFNGVEEILVVCAETAFILGKSETKFSVPFGENIVIYDNRLIIAKETSLYIGGEFDVANLSINLTKFSQINMPSQEGNVLGIVPYEESVVVFFQKSVYILKISDANHFTFTKLNTRLLDVKTSSIAKVGNEIFFISNKKLHVYKNGKIDVLTLLFESCLSRNTKTANAYNEYYLIPFILNSQNYAYMFNTQSRKVHILKGFEGNFFGGKYLHDDDKYHINQINEEATVSLTWNSLKMDFGTHQNKAITSISIISTKIAQIYVYSEKGRDFFTIQEGPNYIKLNLNGKQFNFSISTFYNVDAVIKDLQITYRILGD